MEIFAVRVITSREFVGFYFASDSDDVAWLVDELCDPGACEFAYVDVAGGVYWHDAPEMPAPPDIDEDNQDYWVQRDKRWSSPMLTERLDIFLEESADWFPLSPPSYGPWMPPSANDNIQDDD